MTAKEKAKELVKKYLLKIKIDSRIIGESEVIISKGEIRIESAKQCALIAVDEILKRTRSVDTMPPNCQKIDENTKEYWQQVKQEIEKL